ncbi:GNAT family N-acetyltransferase [Pseudoalteromonas fenneropenaei]|uniref:GNAT family N-acetyltransferase n=1 Tax=Pseudoalteromonas fenneropenaei TaxID=1737459 RepID=A0ABV7CKR0_9GAMM
MSNIINTTDSLPSGIRPAQLADLSAIVAIYNQTIAGRMVTADTEEVSVESRREWFLGHTATRPIFVYEEAGVVLAWISFKSFYGRPAYNGTVEVSIYITKQAQGKGLGKKLLEFAEQFAPSIKVNVLLGFIFSHNLPSIALFERQGFTLWGQLPEIAVMDDKRYSLSIFGKQLDKHTLTT